MSATTSKKRSAISLTVTRQRDYKRNKGKKEAAGMVWIERARPG
jgi:hypothetical protein